jgi:hypothetical protein
MMNQTNGNQGTERKDIGDLSVAWVTPTLEKFSLKDALAKGSGATDGMHTAGGATENS